MPTLQQLPRRDCSSEVAACSRPLSSAIRACNARSCAVVAAFFAALRSCAPYRASRAAERDFWRRRCSRRSAFLRACAASRSAARRRWRRDFSASQFASSAASQLSRCSSTRRIFFAYAADLLSSERRRAAGDWPGDELA